MDWKRLWGRKPKPMPALLEVRATPGGYQLDALRQTTVGEVLQALQLAARWALKVPPRQGAFMEILPNGEIRLLGRYASAQEVAYALGMVMAQFGQTPVAAKEDTEEVG